MPTGFLVITVWRAGHGEAPELALCRPETGGPFTVPACFAPRRVRIAVVAPLVAPLLPAQAHGNHALLVDIGQVHTRRRRPVEESEPMLPITLDRRPVLSLQPLLLAIPKGTWAASCEHDARGSWAIAMGPERQGLAMQQVSGLVSDAKADHDKVKQCIADIQGREPASQEFGDKVRELKTLVLDHVREEEGPLFRDAERLGADALGQLGQNLEARKQTLKTSLMQRAKRTVKQAGHKIA